MAKIKKKGASGGAVKYITRTRAIRKLQVTLADFRRICILKGIYPVEPKSRKKAGKGSSAAHTTFYYTKDIKFLAHEPLIEKFRENKIFLRKIQKAIGRQEWNEAKRIEKNRPIYTLDHLVRERYPTFNDALRDIDDAISMLLLFSMMPSTKQISNQVTEECRRLSGEFLHYVMRTNSLRKVFLSIKGIYYQAEIHGQSITWITPYQFAQTAPTDVDFRVMRTFLEFYRTLMGFVNFRLFSEINLAYPPKIDETMDSNGAGLSALRIEQPKADDLIAKEEGDRSEGSAKKRKPKGDQQKQIQRMSDIQAKIGDIVGEDQDPSSAEATAEDTKDDVSANTNSRLVFSNQTIYLSREVPRESLIFVINGLGGKVGWDKSVAAGSPYDENDERITVQISDRPVQGHQFLNRVYVQPQWVYDSVNAGRLLNAENYAIGAKLPPHLSPFVEYKDGDYVPEAAHNFLAAEGFEGEVTNLKPEDREDYSDDDQSDNSGNDGESEIEGESEVDEEDVDEDLYQNELEAESAGMSYSEYQKSAGSKNTATKRKASKVPVKDGDEDSELKQMAVSMMSKKQRRLYDNMKRANTQKAEEAQTLRQRKANLKSMKSKPPPAHKMKGKKK
ncbi:mRNA-binding ribosome synthesis protein nop7 [Mycoemilia scoparia]|uniref:Pescadillo homolog n=1 Tax=Mycoemilia scoparia TaxID=417184 RepID=A0A9W7ZTG2_9FUNG|nr:mRNA-binding ribosome synthesis protein nop7 [Mycoemilia scoparia]